MGKFVPQCTSERQTAFSFRGLCPPDQGLYPLTRGFAPGPRWGLCLQTPL